MSIAGRVTAADRAGKSVILESDPAPFEGDFGNLGNATTTQSGAYALTDRPTANTRYRVRQGNLTSGVVTVLVRVKVGLRVSDATPAASRRVRFGGRVCPPHVGSVLRIQRRRAGGGWGTVARTTVRAGTANCSRYSKRLRVRRDGLYRAVVSGHDDHARGVSRGRFIDVR